MVMIARAGAPIDGRGEVPLSPAAERELEAAVCDFRGMVRAKAVEHARRRYLDEVSVSHVRAALGDWRSAGSPRRWWAALGAIGWLLGSLLLGGGLNRVMGWVGTRTLDPVSAAVTLGAVVAGIVFLGVSAIMIRR